MSVPFGDFCGFEMAWGGAKAIPTAQMLSKPTAW